MIQPALTLISHHLCPYVQRIVIALTEKGVPFTRKDIDLANKPDWFREMSPLGKTPVLLVDGTAIFESSVILEYLEDSQPHPLLPIGALERAEHRSLIEYSSAVLNDIGGLYSAPDEKKFKQKIEALDQKFAHLERTWRGAVYFAGIEFSLVDAAFGPVFRYFDVFDQIADFGILANKPTIVQWRRALSARPSIVNAVDAGYESRLFEFLRKRQSYLTTLLKKAA